MVEDAAVDEILVRVGNGIGLGASGHRAEARRLLQTVWQDIGGEAGDALHRCAVAHALADVQDEPADELRWDVRALAAAGMLTDDRLTRAGMPGTAAGVLPSLHLNLGDCYRRLGELANAREQLAAGIATLAAMESSGYRAMVEEGLHRLRRRLEASSP